MLTLQLPKTITEERTIPVPCFWKKGYSYYALIDENNLYSVLNLKGYLSILNCDPAENKTITRSYLEDGVDLITEDQFMLVYQDARDMTDLRPSMDYIPQSLESLQLTPKEL